MDQSQQNYLRIVAVVHGPGVNAVRCYFDRCFPPNLLNIQLSSVLRKGLEALKQKKVLSNAQWNILFPANGSASSSTFDLALMTLLLRHFHIKKAPKDGYDKLPVDQDQTPAADLARIKFYRNDIAHSKDGAIEDERFKDVWKHLYDVVDRLGSAISKQQCELLGKADLNMAYKSQCEELSRNIPTLKEQVAALDSQQEQLTGDSMQQKSISKENRNMIKEIIDDIKMQEQATRILEERMKIQLDDISKRLNSKQSTIPQNVEAKIVRQIKSWIEDEQEYVIIEAAVDALDLLRTHSSLTVAGNAGCGKTALIRHLALHFMSQGFEIVPVIEPKTIVDFHDETKKQVFILDDACGIHSIDRRKRMSWLDYGQIIQTCLLQSDSLLLVSVRLSILNSELFEDVKVLSQNVINLKDKKYALSYINRQDIFQSYFKKEHGLLGITDKSLLLHDSFPLLCQLSSRSFLTEADKKVTLITKLDKDLTDLDSFFQTPLQVIKSEIRAIKMDSPISYCLLVLCLLFNGKLPKLDLSFSNRHKSLLEDCYSVCGLNKGTPIKALTDTAKNVTDVYLKEVDGTLVFVHDIIMDIVSVCFGEQCPDIILKYADIEVIINRVLLTEIKTEATGYKVLIPEYYHVEFFHRLYTEIGKGNARQIFNHCQLEIQWIQISMTSYLKTKSDDELRHIFFQDEDKNLDHYQKLNLRLMDIWAQTLDTKPIEIENHTLLELVANNAFHWLLGKGLFEIIRLLEERVCGDVYRELKADSLCTFIAILGGNLKVYSWILNIKDGGKLWQHVKNTMFRNKQLMYEFQWAVMTGRTDIVEYLLSKEMCVAYINESITPYDMLKIFAKLFRFSFYKLKIILFLSKLMATRLSKLIRKFGRIRYNLENVLFYSEFASIVFYTEDERFNHLIFKKFKSEIEPIIVKLYNHRVEFQCSQFPLPGSIFDDTFGRLEAKRTYLTLAAIHGHVSVTNVLLLKGANPNKISFPSNNVAKLCTTLPIVHAAMYGRLEIVKSLLQYGAKIESTGPKGCTLLMFASSYGHYNVAQFLLDKPIAIDIKNSFQNTALLYASKKGHARIVQLLLEHGAIVNSVCHRSSTPLIEAASGGYLVTTEKLLHHSASVNACDNKKMNALIKAAMNGHFEIVKLLVDNQSAVNLQTNDNETALTLAAKNGHLKVVAFLMSYSYQCVNDNYISQERELSVFENENRFNFSQLPFSTSHLFQITKESDEVNLAFLNAYQNNHINVLQCLLENGADVQMKYSKSLTLLNTAASKGEYEIVNLLLVNGASLQKRGNFRVSPLVSASCGDHTDIIKLLVKHGCDVNSKTDLLPIFLTYLETIWIQDHCKKSNLKNLNAFNDHSATALIYAAQKETSESLEVLLQDKNININSQTFLGRTALMVACGNQREDIVDVLLKNNANVNIVSKFGATSLDIALADIWGNENIINSLLRNGAVHSRDLNSFPKGRMHAVNSQYDLDQIWFFIRILVFLLLSKYIPVCQ